MNPISSFSGLASGIQWRDLVDQIIQAESLRRVAPLSEQSSAEQRRVGAWNTFQGLVTKLGDAARALKDGSAFERFTTSVGTTAAGRALFTASAAASAAPGTYAVTVLDVARAEKLGSTLAVADPNADLQLAGEFHLNGRTLSIGAGDSLNTVRDKINAANAGGTRTGVTATIFSPVAGEHRLVLTADQTGARGIELTDLGGGVIGGLGITGAGAPAANTSAEGKVQTQRFTDADTTSVATMLGLSSPPLYQRITIDGREIGVDLQVDTLQSILNKLTAAGGAGRIVEEAVNGRTLQRLEVDGAVTAAGVTADEIADSQRTMGLLGFTRAERANPITLGTDARLTIDSFAVTRRSNTVTDVIPGLTLNVQHAEPNEAVVLTVARDVEHSVEAAEGFAAAYNEIRTFIDAQRAAGQPLANNGTLRATMSSLTSVMLTAVEGLTTQYDRGALVGLSLSRTGELNLDVTAFTAALETNLTDVRTLFAGETVNGSPVDGLAARMLTMTTAATQSGDGTIAIQLDSLSRSIDSLGRRREDAEARLDLRQQALIKQFTAMEQAIGKLQAQGSWLTSYINAMQPQKG